MAVRYLENSTVITDVGTAAVTWTVTAPANIPKDALILIVIGTTATATVQAPAGWSLVNGAGQNGGSDCTGAILYRKASEFELGAWTLTNLFAGVAAGRAVTLIYTGQDLTTPIHKAASASDASGTTTSGPSITTGIGNCKILQVITSDPAAATFAVHDRARGAIKRFDGNDNSFNAWVFVQEYEQAAAGAIALDAVESAALNFAVFQFAIAPGTPWPTNAFE